MQLVCVQSSCYATCSLCACSPHDVQLQSSCYATCSLCACSPHVTQHAACAHACYNSADSAEEAAYRSTAPCHCKRHTLTHTTIIVPHEQKRGGSVSIGFTLPLRAAHSYTHNHNCATHEQKRGGSVSIGFTLPLRATQSYTHNQMIVPHMNRKEEAVYRLAALCHCERHTLTHTTK